MNIFTNFTTLHFEALKILLGIQTFAKIGFFVVYKHNPKVKS
jgi:hypothetical protein